MSHRIAIAALLFLATICGSSLGQFLQMGLDNVAWENSADSGPLLFRQVNAADLVSVRAKISAQTSGNWSQAGVIVRVPNAIDAVPGQENWQTSWSFRPAGDFVHQSNAVTAGAEAELNDGGLTAAALNYVRLDNLGGGMFQAFRGSGPDDSNITWTAHTDGAQTNAALSGVPLQVGIAAGAIGPLAGASVAFDWVEIQTTTQTLRDDFNYTHDFTTGVPGGGIWTGVENAAAGGVPTRAGNVGSCTVCTWNINSGDFNNAGNWTPGILFAPNKNDVQAVFGPTQTVAGATVFTNTNVTVKELRFDNATTMFALSGAGSITLEADTGNALINVLQGNHEIQVDLVLNDNVTATAAAGTSLNINTPVYLNGNTFTVSAGSTVILNNGTVIGAPGAGAGAGLLANDGSVSGLSSLGADLVQSSGGRLAVEVGGAPVQVAGDATLDGVLDVSLLDGFVPVPGEAYPVLTANRVTDLGLTLGGDGAGRFQLLVGENAVSLVAAAIPEPGTVALAVIGLAAVGFVRRRRTPCVATEGESTLKRPLRPFLSAVFFIAAASSVSAQTLVETRRDDFGDPTMPHAMQHDYTTGTVPLGKMWNGIHNPTNGGSPEVPAILVADGFAFDGSDKAGKLHVEDLGLHPNSNATLGVGWEAQGDKNNAPFLFTTFSGEPEAQYDFDAVVKIDAQSAGNWSYAAIVARVAGPPVGICCGQDEANSFATTGPNAENFVTAGVFRTDAANPDNATLLIQNTLNGGVGQGDIIVDLAPAGAVGGGATTPVWLRLMKRGAEFKADSSLDGNTWFDDPATANSTVNAELNVAGRTLEVGLAFMTFPGGVSGNVDFDFFQLDLFRSEIPTSATWNVPGSGNWNTATNWLSIPPGTVPNFDTMEVVLGSAITAPATVFNNGSNIAKSLRFNNANKYAVGGTGTITMQSDTGTSDINVDMGEHEIQLDLALANPTTITAAAGTQLDINNTLNFTNAVTANRTLSIAGPGRVNINNNIDLPVTNALVTVNGGHVGGNGRINGRLTNTGGSVSPGTSIGTLTVEGNFQQNSAGTLNIELGGLAVGMYDRLQIIGGLNGAILDGTLDVHLVNGYVPVVGNTFDIITAAGGINNTAVISLHSSDAPFYSLSIVGATILRLTVTNPISVGIAGDFNNNGVVDAADYAVWRDNNGTNNALQNDGGLGTPVGTAHYNLWRANFGKTPGSGTSLDESASVPEPASVGLMLTTLAAALAMARRRS